jgi:hypothetical protein
MKGLPQRIRRDDLGDLGAAGGRADDLPGAVPVQSPPVSGQEQRAVRRCRGQHPKITQSRTTQATTSCTRKIEGNSARRDCHQD